jgi:hypothetical protein
MTGLCLGWARQDCGDYDNTCHSALPSCLPSELVLILETVAAATEQLYWCCTPCVNHGALLWACTSVSTADVAVAGTQRLLPLPA